MNELKKMKLKEVHKDMERYLEFDCYCPNEIYDMSGFFYQLFEPIEECYLLGISKGGNNRYFKDGYSGIYVISNKQIIEFSLEHETDKICGAVRMDATENNIKIFKEIIETGKVPSEAKLDKFEDNHSDKDLKKILGMCDCVIMD